MIYILLLKDSKFYVGYTEQLLHRILQHFTDNGSQFTLKYKPLKLLQVMEGDQQLENSITLQLMLIFGFENVRGGKWCQLELINEPIELTLLRDRIYSCTRCGRKGHLNSNCYARYHRNGLILDNNLLLSISDTNIPNTSSNNVPNLGILDTVLPGTITDRELTNTEFQDTDETFVIDLTESDSDTDIWNQLEFNLQDCDLNSGLIEMQCTRCYRNGHLTSSCFALIDNAGAVIIE